MIFITFLLSSWVLLNEMGRWYFVASYISLSMAILLTVEHLYTNNFNVKIIKVVLIVIISIGAISPIYTMKYVSPKTLRPKADIVGEFKQLGNIGVIAEYWNSYITSCTNPDMIKATPHDKTGAVRNYRITNDVFNQKNIYVIRDMWLTSFPDSLTQFGRLLLKDGNEFEIGDCNVCKYKQVKSYNK
jgi:hypothetical protein